MKEIDLKSLPREKLKKRETLIRQKMLKARKKMRTLEPEVRKYETAQKLKNQAQHELSRIINELAKREEKSA